MNTKEFNQEEKTKETDNIDEETDIENKKEQDNISEDNPDNPEETSDRENRSEENNKEQEKREEQKINFEDREKKWNKEMTDEEKEKVIKLKKDEIKTSLSSRGIYEVAFENVEELSKKAKELLDKNKEILERRKKASEKLSDLIEKHEKGEFDFSELSGEDKEEMKKALKDLIEFLKTSLDIEEIKYILETLKEELGSLMEDHIYRVGIMENLKEMIKTYEELQREMEKLEKEEEEEKEEEKKFKFCFKKLGIFVQYLAGGLILFLKKLLKEEQWDKIAKRLTGIDHIPDWLKGYGNDKK